MFNLYSHIEALAKANGYPNIQKLCIDAGIRPSVLSNLNNDLSKSLSLKTAQKLATALGVSVDAVYGRTSAISDSDIKAAFWGGEHDLTPQEIDELWNETKDYIEYATLRKKKKK